MPLVPIEEPVVPIEEPLLVDPDCWTGVPSLRVLLLPVTGVVVVGALIVADGVVPLPAAPERVVPVADPLVSIVPDVPEVPVDPWVDSVGLPSLRVLSLAVTGAVVVGAVVVADGVVGVVCAPARPIELSNAAAAAAVLRRCNVFIVRTPWWW